MKKKPRKLYYTNSSSAGLLVIVDKERGSGILKSYGAGHGTELDELLSREGIDSVHPDNHLEISNEHYRSMIWLAKEKLPVVLKILSDYYQATPVEMEWNAWFKLIGVK